MKLDFPSINIYVGGVIFRTSEILRKLDKNETSCPPLYYYTI